MTRPLRSRMPVKGFHHPVVPLAATLLLLACADDPAADATGSQYRGRADVAGSSVGGDPFQVGTLGALAGRLPSTDTVTSSVPAFEIKQKGNGIAGRFEITNPASAAIALDGVNSGVGHALLAWNLGLGRAAVVITSNSSNTLPALDVSSQSRGSSTVASAVDIRASNTSATGAAVRITAQSPASPALLVNHASTTTAGALAIFQAAGANMIRFGHNGKGFFNGGVQSGGADVAEAFEVEGSTRDYAPGDVLALSDRGGRRVVKSDEAYSTRVAGVYATKPGLVLTERGIDESLEGTVPLGIIGVIPTKASAENGAIRPGDLLVAAATPGHAMRGTDRTRMLGAILGKAIDAFDGPGTGVVRVLVNVK